MSEIIHSHIVKTRKDHICFGCGRTFPKGTDMRRDAITDSGTVWTAYLCKSCQAVESELDWDDEYGFSDLRERSLEIEKGDA